MDHTRHIKILYGLVVLLLAVVVGMGALWRYSPNSGPGLSVGQNTPGTHVASSTPDLSKVIVGDGGSAMQYARGAITELGSNSMKVKDSNTGAVDTVAISANTKLQLGGKVKDTATQQQDLAAYNAQVTTLMKDPVKNQAALAALQIPSAQIMTSATLADFRVGDTVLITASSVDSSGTYVATVITKNPAQ